MSQLGNDPLYAIPATRALRRSRGRWRIFAFVALAIAIVVGLVRFVPDMVASPSYIARVEISGTITTSNRRLEALKALAENDAVEAVIVAINSPGGTTAGGEEIYEALRALADAKPTIAIINEVGASAAYMTAIATDQIFARRLSIIGSIGVLYRHVDAGRLLDTIGIDLDKVTSGILKAEPDVGGPMSPEVRESIAALVQNSYGWFVDIVAERRDLSRASVLAVADGRIMTGAMGVESGLIDQIGGQAEAIEWLAATYEIDAELPVHLHWPPPSRTDWISVLLGEVAGQALGIEIDGRMTLDGLVSVWHPSN